MLKARRHEAPARAATTGAMNIVVHDFAGHPFQVELSRELARRGNGVLHLHCASDNTPKGRLTRTPDDPPNFEVNGLELRGTFAKYHPTRRMRDEFQYARNLVGLILQRSPDVVLSSNTPLGVQYALARACSRRRTPFIFWQQDILSVGSARVVARSTSLGGRLVGATLGALEGGALRASSYVIPISRDFLPQLETWNVRPERVRVIENWAPLSELRPTARDNSWAVEQGLVGAPVALYAGTLGMKHDPGLLWDLAERFRSARGWKLVVVGGGRGAAWLADRLAHTPNDALMLLPYQPYDRLDEVLGSAEVLLAVLEGDSGAFSVPSKVLSYHCAGRPIVGAIPHGNAAARVITSANSGVVVDPGSSDAFAGAVSAILSDPARGALLGRNARVYAESHFGISGVGEQFIDVMRHAVVHAGRHQ